mgnify:CR=1 FL=1
MKHSQLFIALALLFMCACSGKDYNLYEYTSTHLIDEYVDATTFKLDRIDDNLVSDGLNMNCRISALTR